MKIAIYGGGKRYKKPNSLILIFKSSELIQCQLDIMCYGTTLKQRKSIMQQTAKSYL
jgi:hypothetical protein